MENLFYSRSVTHKFDLKGSVRNRLVNPTAADHDGEIVLLDENLLKSKYDCHCGESVLANRQTHTSRMRTRFTWLRIGLFSYWLL
jgi:hypothetical protein